jgi:hypothetical protein
MAYPNIYQKSVLFEIINKQNPGEIVDAFTLTIPPDSIEVIQSQRITRTKTFGGVFEDDYGMDVAKITISGTTGNSELRATYIPGKGSPQTYSGKQAIYALRDKIARYKVGLEAKALENYEIRYYDLSVLAQDDWDNSINDPQSSLGSSIESWIVSLDDFKIGRSKDRPLWYTYSIELLAIAPLGVNRQVKAASVSEPIIAAEPASDTVGNIVKEMGKDPTSWDKFKSAMLDAVKSLQRGLNAVRNAYAWGQNKLNEFDNVNKLVSDLTDQMTEYIAASGNLVTTSFGIYRRLFNIAKFPGAAAKAAMEATVAVMNGLKDTVEFNATLSATLGDDYNQIALLADETQRIAAKIVAFGKSADSKTDTVVTLGADKPLTIQGTKVIAVPEGTTLAQIAMAQYGDPSKAELLALYNGISDDEIVAGTLLIIPILVQSIRNRDNKLYGTNVQSAFGVDMVLNMDSGALVVSESGDFATVFGAANLVQAINLRLSEQLGTRLQLTTYGLRADIGSAQNNSAPISYILTSIVDTLVQDPRIAGIVNIRIRGQGGVLFIAFNAKTIAETIAYEGAL